MRWVCVFNRMTMRNRNLYITILLSSLFSLSACGQREQYTLIWEDNFDGDTLNTAYWNVEDNARGGGNAEMQYYTPRNISFENYPGSNEHCLVLNAKREDYGNRPATSVRLNTQDKVTVQYGKIEARIAFPYTANGIWPAFWMLGNDIARDLGNDDTVDTQATELARKGQVVWPRCGEIDIVEMGHRDGIAKGLQDRYFNGAAHWGEAYNNGEYPNRAGICEAPYAIQGDFHLFTVEWSEDSLAMYLDKDQYPEVAPYFALSLRNKEVNEPGHYFNKPFYLLFNLAVGGYFTGLPTNPKYPELVTADDPNFQQITGLPTDGTPVKMYVDYVRIYKENK